jgi:type I restriction-modification system DNA methylase subunit
MGNTSDILFELTDPQLPSGERRRALKRFADETRWVPSEEIDEYPGTELMCNGHLVVEHGLNNSAVITFLRRDRPFNDLTEDDQVRILSISYNNLVDWHLFPDPQGLTRVFNRVQPIRDGLRYISRAELAHVWRAEAFEQITGRRPNPNVRGLDDALMATISFWKRALASDLKSRVKNENISALFNSLIFTRAMEDFARRRNPALPQILVEVWNSPNGRPRTIGTCIRECIRRLCKSPLPQGILEAEKLSAFDDLEDETVSQIFRDFYVNKFALYRYDFSLMSKHALSRIYEHYVSLLSPGDSPQLTFWEDLPKESRNRVFGGIYTPQYVAKFFARCLKENHTPATFRRLKTGDPACGSGIFLRTVLEMQCDPMQDIDMAGPTREAFANVVGIDIDENACQATRLSLSLLHLILTGEFPEGIRIIKADALAYYRDNRDTLRGSFDAVIANPPFIKWQNMSPEERQSVRDIAQPSGRGQADKYLAFLKIGMDIVKPGGYLLYVLPHSFLMADSARTLRASISSEYWIRFLVDLSEIEVFEGVGSYVILLVLQRKREGENAGRQSTIVTCKDFPGEALQAALEGKRASTDFYSVYEVDPRVLARDEWQLMSPPQIGLAARLERFPLVEEFFEVRVGFKSGASKIFIREASDIPPEEKNVYVPYLQDRDMLKYMVPEKVAKVVFYPYVSGERIDQATLRRDYPETWTYLKQHRQALSNREGVKKNTCEWWSPERARRPENMLRPKIVSPHLVLLPRFSLDLEGRYGVSHCPLMYLKDETANLEVLKYFLGVLNSSVCYWQIANLSHKYGRGYLMLEKKTLARVRVPAPASVAPAHMKRLLRLVDRQLRQWNPELDGELDDLVAGLYGLTDDERREVGLALRNA